MIIKKFNQFINEVKGSDYESTRDLDITKIAKLIKEELKIIYPDWKFSIKTDRFSGGQSLDVYIEDIPYNPYSAETDEMFKNNTDIVERRREDYYNETFNKDYQKIKHIQERYNRDDSDPMTDYFSVHYYGHVNVDEYKIKAKYYPAHPDVKRHEEFNKEWDEKSAKAKEVRDQLRGKFKKDSPIIYTYNRVSPSIPKGDYEGKILKSPSGAGFYPTYKIEFYVTQRFLNGEVVQLPKPSVYITNVSVLEENKTLKLKN